LYLFIGDNLDDELSVRPNALTGHEGAFACERSEKITSADSATYAVQANGLLRPDHNLANQYRHMFSNKSVSWLNHHSLLGIHNYT